MCSLEINQDILSNWNIQSFENTTFRKISLIILNHTIVIFSSLNNFKNFQQIRISTFNASSLNSSLNLFQFNNIIGKRRISTTGSQMVTFLNEFIMIFDSNAWNNLNWLCTHFYNWNLEYLYTTDFTFWLMSSLQLQKLELTL